jgi:protein-S-isoprenylcysteine O-methyltransferase Ste14
MLLEYLGCLGLCLASLLIRTSYELFKKAGRESPKSKIVFALVFVAMCLMLASWPVMCPLDPWHLALPNTVQWLGLGIVMVGLGLAIGALIHLRGLENIDHLITTGLFSKFRHPMYAGLTLWVSGWVIYYGAVVSLVIGFVTIGNILYWRQLEEEKLEVNYGEACREYQKRTWF